MRGPAAASALALPKMNAWTPISDQECDAGQDQRDVEDEHADGQGGDGKRRQREAEADQGARCESAAHDLGVDDRQQDLGQAVAAKNRAKGIGAMPLISCRT